MKIKKNKKKKIKESVAPSIKSAALFLRLQLGKGLTLQEVAMDRDIPYSQLVDEINSSPSLIQAMKDGKEQGKAYWIKKLKTAFYNKDANTTLIRLWFNNYMDWSLQPMPQDFDENTTVIINVSVRHPTKKEKKAEQEAREL